MDETVPEAEKKEPAPKTSTPQPPINPFYIRKERITLQEGPATLEVPFHISKESVREFEYWMEGLCRRLKLRTDLIENDDAK